MSTSRLQFEPTQTTQDFIYPYVKATGYYSNIKDKRLNPIPSNTIIYKCLTGIGATTTEILEKRNSIIVLPNLPVIKSKQAKHGVENDTFAIYEDVRTEELVNYLLRKDVRYKKILTTPESFVHKVKLAMRQLRLDMYQDYFLLFDEGHKYILDNNYRDDIILPFEDFFQFTNKAIISATPVRLSDPRFSEQRFVTATIDPIYDIKQDLKVIHTNNISYALRKNTENAEQPNCIFYNSIDGIKSVMKSLGIAEESRIYCSIFSKSELEIQEYSNVYSEFDPQLGLAKYNFFTSSFYNGLDIDLADKPNLIIVTSVKFADHTVVDPYSDVIQIAGRFRNGVNSMTHITNTDDKINYLTPAQITDQFNTSADVYRAIKTLKLSASDPYAQQLYSEALGRIYPYANLLNKQKGQRPNNCEEMACDDEALENYFEQEGIESVNYFKLDNYFYQNRVKGYYADIKSLISAYEQTRSFNVTLEICYNKIDSQDFLKRLGSKLTSPKVYLDVANILWQMEGMSASEPFEYARQLRILEQRFPYIVNAYFKLGPQGMLALEYNHRKIQRAVIKVDALRGINSHPVMDAVYAMIKKGAEIPLTGVKEILADIYKEYDIAQTAKATDIHHFFKVRAKKVKVRIKKKVEWQRGYKILEPLFNTHPEYKRP